jgi:hypothetical protein
MRIEHYDNPDALFFEGSPIENIAIPLGDLTGKIQYPVG